MCGITGSIIKFPLTINKEQFIENNNKHSLRGPDDSGVYIKDNIALGHRRLSVIDLASGGQPMISTNHQVCIVFNGEIYNYKKLKSELILQGVSFKNESDTEVILNAYIYWGIDKLLDKLEGMFAFAIADYEQGNLIIARDKFGEKPLFYAYTEKAFYFASELKALVSNLTNKTIDEKALQLYFQLSYIPQPHTIYKEAKKMEPGTYLIIDKDLKISSKKYFNFLDEFKNGQENPILNYKQAKEILRKKMFQSVADRMVADVPIGAFLSGGIDSSIISAIMAKLSDRPINTFSIGFDEKAYDESDRASLIAKHIGSNHQLLKLNHQHLLNSVNDVIQYFDEPYGDSSAVAAYWVAKMAREKVTVVLTGDCADELFGGYEKYLAGHYAKKWTSLPKFVTNTVSIFLNFIPHNNYTNHFLRKVKKVILSANLEPAARYANLTSMGFNNKERALLFKHTAEKTDIEKYFLETETKDELANALYSDVKLVLEGDMLPKVDRTCMMNSLEARVPFLDSELVKFAFTLPNQFKILGNNKKRILKDSFADLLPKETFKFSKKGFGLPLRIWFKNELKIELEALLERSFLEKQNIFNVIYIEQLVQEHMSNKQNHSSKLWLLFVFQKWYLKHIQHG